MGMTGQLEANACARNQDLAAQKTFLMWMHAASRDLLMHVAEPA